MVFCHPASSEGETSVKQTTGGSVGWLSLTKLCKKFA